MTDSDYDEHAPRARPVYDFGVNEFCEALDLRDLPYRRDSSGISDSQYVDVYIVDPKPGTKKNGSARDLIVLKVRFSSHHSHSMFYRFTFGKPRQPDIQVGPWCGKTWKEAVAQLDAFLVARAKGASIKRALIQESKA
jgi:hypothetical protein